MVVFSESGFTDVQHGPNNDEYRLHAFMEPDVLDDRGEVSP